MKAILVIDMPDECGECPCYNDEYTICQIDGRKVGAFSPVQDWCPLKPMPKKHDNVPKHEYELGWNDCIEEIEGESYARMYV